MIYIYYSNISDWNLSQDELTSFSFPPEFQERIKRFRQLDDAKRSCIGRVLLRKVLKNHFDMDLDFYHLKYSDYGKPYLPGEQIDFSISHSGKLVVCAVCPDGKVGVDIELIQEVDISEFDTHLTASEWNYISEVNESWAFLDYWTKKEAILKGTGCGLNIPLNSFEIKGNKTYLNGETWYINPLRMNCKYRSYMANNKNYSYIVSEFIP